MIGIYKFTNRFDGKCYIGKSVNIEKRYKSHIRNLKNGVKTYFYNALRKYGPENFYFDVLIECHKENLNYWEKFYIRYYCSNIHQYGYNCTIGGDGGKTSEKPWNYNKPFRSYMDEETIRIMSKKISKANKGQKKPPRTPEHCKHLSESNKGRVSTFKGKHFTEEQLSRLRAIRKTQKHPKHWKLDPVTNKRIYFD